MDVVRQDPANRSAQIEAASLLRELGGSYGAGALLNLPPPTDAGTGRLALEADQAGAQVRWGGMVQPRETEDTAA